MRGRTAAYFFALLAASAAGSCFGPDPNLTETGKGLPRPSASFPANVEAGSTQELLITVENPGPEDISSVIVAFTRVGDPDLPQPIVEAGARGENPSVAGIDPEPVGISEDGVVYRFGELPEGDSLSIIFDLRIPDVDGTVGNAVQVYDGAEPDRGRGVRFEAEITSD